MITMFASTCIVILFVLLVVLVCGSLLTLSSSPHWFVRGWDFPRLQILALGWLLFGGFLVMDLWVGGESPIAMPWFLVLVALLTGWLAFHMIPYTRLFPQQVKSTCAEGLTRHVEGTATLRLTISNVEEENEAYETWMQTMEAADPDVLVVLEVDNRWVTATQRVIDKYPYRVIHPQNNWYGMMMLSKLPIESHKLRFLVQDDVPSIDADIRLNEATLIRVVAVHPRPPEPIRGNDAIGRDAELTLWGRELAEETRPVIIGGDLNDVAWSPTTRLFLRTSGLLDPRRGRGLFNTFNANYFFLRFPVDHIFVSPHFTVSGMDRLPFVGSDHFPMRFDLAYQPEAIHVQHAMEKHESDDEAADLRIERAIEDSEMDGDLMQRVRATEPATEDVAITPPHHRDLQQVHND